MLDLWYMEFISCLDHGQPTAKGSNRIILSNYGKPRITLGPQGIPGTARMDKDRAGIARDRAGIARERAEITGIG